MDLIPRDWYKTWFGNQYLTVYAYRNEKEAKLLINLIHSNIKLSPQSKILDLCCGQGRHALLLAKMGYRVVGIDLSRTLLEIAKFKTEKNQKASFIQADMRFLPTINKFDLLLNLFTSFGYLDTDDENISVFRQFKIVLKQGGNFVFDYFNSQHVVENLIPYHKARLGDMLIEQERYIERSRVLNKISLSKKGNTSIFYESVKMYQPEEIFKMLKQAEEKGRRVKLGGYFTKGNVEGIGAEKPSIYASNVNPTNRVERGFVVTYFQKGNYKRDLINGSNGKS